jgi:hypothetical protein
VSNFTVQAAAMFSYGDAKAAESLPEDTSVQSAALRGHR